MRLSTRIPCITAILTAGFLLLAGCAPPQMEPAYSGQVPVTRTLPPLASASSPAEFSTDSQPPSSMPALPPPTVLTTTPWDPSQPRPTRTPVPPPPGLIYHSDEGLWRVATDWQPVFVADRPGLILSPDGRLGLYQEEDDIWLVELASGETLNLTGGAGRKHCCPRWWSARPEVILFGSWPADSDLGPSTGFLSAVNVDGSNYAVLDEEVPSNALPAPGKDGQTIAYDRAGSAWLFRWGSGPEPFDPSDYGLPDVARMGGPSWSPDGRQLAWTVAVTDPVWRIALAVFDLEQQVARLLHPYENVGRGGWFPPPTWSPDGRWLAFVAEATDPAARGVWVVAADGSSEAFLGDGVDPIWSPDNHWLLFTGLEASDTGTERTVRLAQVASWYTIQMFLPPGAVVAGWTEVQGN